MISTCVIAGIVIFVWLGFYIDDRDYPDGFA